LAKCTWAGSKKSGEGSGDDEVINVDLSLIPEHVEQTFGLVL